MIRLPKLRTIAAAAGAFVAMVAATPASAFVYATSHLEIKNLMLAFDPTVVIKSFTFGLTNTADINGNGDFATKTCTKAAGNCGLGPVLDARQAVAPDSTGPYITALKLPAGENTYSFATSPDVRAIPSNSFSRSDSIITTAQLVTGTPTSTNQIAESLLNVTGTASANSEVKSNTSLTATFTGTRNVNLSFDADPDQLAEIGGGSTGISALSNLNASFTLLKNGVGAGSVSFTPNAAGAADCVVSANLVLAGVTCLVIDDTQDLNFNAGIGSAGTSENSFESANTFTHFAIRISGLANSDYSVAFNAVTSTLIEAQVVPEPGTAGLVGAALAGLALTVRRKRKQS